MHVFPSAMHVDASQRTPGKDTSNLGQLGTGFVLKTPRARPRALGLAFDVAGHAPTMEAAAFPEAGVKCVLVLKPLGEAQPASLVFAPARRALTLRKLNQGLVVEEVRSRNAWHGYTRLP